MKLKSFIFALFLFFCFFVVSREVLVFGDDCPEVVDQQQLLDGTLAGFGEFDNSNGKGGVRYRGQGFTNLLEVLTAVEFNLEKVGFADLRVFIDTAKEDSTPEHDINGALFSFTIPNSELKEGMTKYSLPKELNVVHGKKYVMYFAPYKNGEYCDDYRDMVWSLSNPYDGGKGVMNINGEWSISDWGNIDLQFKTYGRECSVPPPPPTPNPTCTPTPEPQPTPTCTPDPQPTPIGKNLEADYTLPWDDQSDVDPMTFYRIEVGFSESMDAGGFISESSIALKRTSGNGEILPVKEVKVDGNKVYFYIVPGTVGYDQGFKATIFRERVRSAKGEKLKEDYIWTFGTREDPNPQPTPTPILEELKVERTIPANGETGVSTEIDRLTAFFNFNIDESVGPFSAELKEVESGVKISLSYISLFDNEVKFFFTKGSLKPDKIYQAMIFKDKVKGKNGTRLESDYSWTFSTGTTVPTPTPTPPPPTPTPTPQDRCGKVEIFHLSTRDMEITVAEESEFIVTVECEEEGSSLQGIPIHARIIRWSDKKAGKISLNGLSKKYERQTILTDDSGKARFVVEGLKEGRVKIKVNADKTFGFFKDVVKVRVKK